MKDASISGLSPPLWTHARGAFRFDAGNCKSCDIVNPGAILPSFVSLRPHTTATRPALTLPPSSSTPAWSTTARSANSNHPRLLSLEGTLPTHWATTPAQRKVLPSLQRGNAAISRIVLRSVWRRARIGCQRAPSATTRATSKTRTVLDRRRIHDGVLWDRCPTLL